MCSEDLGFHHFQIKSPCNLLVEDYIEVFYMIHNVVVPFVQCEMNIRLSKSVTEVDGPNFIFFFF
jgi:hypothetical protein